MSHKEKRQPDYAKALVLILLLIITGCQTGTTGLIDEPVTQQPTATTGNLFFSPIGGTDLISPIPSAVPTPMPQEPDYSLTGKILFHSERNGNFDIFEMDVATKRVMALTNHPAREIEPVWSAENEQILFASSKEDMQYLQLYTMERDGSDQRPITHNKGFSLSGKWSSDGKSVVYHSNKSGNFDIYILNLATGKETQLTQNPRNDAMPSWSPDASKVVFMSDRDNASGEIYVIDVETRQVTRLTNSPGADILPQWSPAGDKILFVSTRYGPQQLYAMNPNGSDVQRLSVGDNFDSTPSWAENGKSILFSSSRDGDREIYVMAVDGSQQTRLTTSPGEDSFPVWIPDHQQ